MQRRNATVDRYYKQVEERTEKARKAIVDQEREVVDNQMQVEKHERKTLKHAKA